MKKPNRLLFFCLVVYNIFIMSLYWGEIMQPQLKALIKAKNIAVFMIFVFIIFGVYNFISTPVSNAIEPVTITIKKGMSTHDIGNILYEKGIVKNAFIFRAMAKIQGLDSNLQAGNYVFTRRMSSQEIVKMLSQGQTAYNEITIPEGYTVKQIAKLIEDKKLGNKEKFIQLAKHYEIYNYMKGNGQVEIMAEGFVFPATYRLAADVTEQELLEMMVKQFDKVFDDKMRQQAANKGLSIRQVVILASLVEKEAQLDSDRPIIAGVFFNRLKNDMPLQSCATIQYILGYPKPELTVSDTQIESPYNTYINRGLPPGPIANPGIDAIKAVLYPAETDFLYFVADKNGAHHFSRTYEEHLEKINEVRK